MHGRPVGKRVTPEFFTEHVAEHGIEVCDYLLAVDVDMNPLPGYRFANWDLGYGDMLAVPTTPRPGTSPGFRAPPWSSATSATRRASRSRCRPRQILRRQIDRAAERGFRVLSATELEFFLFRDTYEEAQAEAGRA